MLLHRQFVTGLLPSFKMSTNTAISAHKVQIVCCKSQKIIRYYVLQIISIVLEFTLFIQLATCAIATDTVSRVHSGEAIYIQFRN